MPQLDFNAMMGSGPQGVYQGFMQGQEIQNKLAQEAQQRQLGQIQLQNALREQKAAEEESAAWKTGANDPQKILQELQNRGLGKQAMALQKQLLETQASKLKQQKDIVDLVKHTANQIYANPENAVSILASFNKQTGVDVSDDIAQIQNLGGNIDAIKKWALGHAVEADKLLPQFKEFSTPGGGKEIGTVNPLTAEFTPSRTLAPQMTPGEIASNRIAAGNLGINAQRLAFEKEKSDRPVFNSQAGGFIAPPTAANPQGKFIPATDIQAAKDQQAAVKALQSAGYDPKTGEDVISKLIAKSTSGMLQAGTSATLAFFGKTTEGRKAISALEGTANQIATDLAGGKLGAGISNTDRDFIVGALGDVANPMKTAEQRLAGWNAAKERMLRVGLLPPPSKVTPNTPAAPNIDALLKKYQ